MDSEDKFAEKQLPPKAHFYNRLSDEDIDDDKYAHAQKVWNTFGIDNLGQFHDLYVASDVLQLADVFENFRNTCLEYYHLDPAHFYTAPGLAWQAALKMTRVELELLTDIDMHHMVEKGLRGGISVITKRWAKANNPHVPDYDEKKPNSYIIYLDANNLYGWAMSLPLPTHGFRWLSPSEIIDLDICSIPDEADVGYILEVDLEYPSHLHDYHSDYPLAPEQLTVTEDMLSKYCRNVAMDLQLSTKGSRKLVPNLYNKERYVVHYRNLQFYIKHGLRLKKIHRVIEFNQSPWLATYIHFNTSKRMQAKNATEKEFFKLMNNSVFGKTMENLRKRINVKLVVNEKQALYQIVKPSFQGFKRFSDNFVAVHHRILQLELNRPIYCGFSILDNSKMLMYQYHYEHIIPRYGKHANLLFTDTDSLTYHVTTHDIYKDMSENKTLYDFSDYPKHHPLYDVTNKKVIGKFKDELSGNIAQEFVGLRSKMYSILHDDEIKKAKGVKKNVVRNDLTHNMFKTSLFEKHQYSHKMNRIASDHHQIYLVSQMKTSLSPYDDKRYHS